MSCPEIVKVYTKENYNLIVLFSNGIFKEIDVSIFFDKFPSYQILENYKIFSNPIKVTRFLIKWNDNVDIFNDTIYELGKTCKEVESPTIPLLGYKLKIARINKDISQIKLSRLTGIDQSEISKIENGLNNPSIEYIEKITTALGVHLLIDISD